jgi:hypothetical protein
MFDINFYSKTTDFHRYSTEDLALLSIGLGNYTKSSVLEFFNTTRPNPDVAEFFSKDASVVGKIRGLGLEGTMQILDFDIVDKTYKIKTGLTEIVKLNPQKYPVTKYQPVPAGSIDIFLDNWNKVQIGDPSIPQIQANTYRAIVDRIHNSASGCLSFKATFTVLGGPRTANIMLVPTYSRDNQSSRTIAFRGSPLISAIPQTAEGLAHSQYLTNQLGIGQYAGLFEGGINNPKNTVAGNLRLTYNPTTGEFESGTQQILVRLVDDIEPAEMSDIRGEALLSATAEDCYASPESDLYMGNFKKGRGIPLSMENGNPHMYGPNFKGGCASSSAKSVITVVNRAAQSFKSGQLVMCSRIGGEWVILPTGEQSLTKKITFGNFEYQQYIIPADSYFAHGALNSISLTRVMPDDFARKMRNSYYIDLYNNKDPRIIDESMNSKFKIVLLNIFASTIPTDFIEGPLKYIKDNYKTEEAAELMKEADAEKKLDTANFLLRDIAQDGVSDLFYPDITFDEITNSLPKNVLLKTARKFSTDGATDASSSLNDPAYGDEVPFWGMLFPDGYKTNSTAPVIAEKGAIFRNNPLFANDKNLKELSVLSSLSYPYIKDQVTNLGLIKKIDSTQQTDPFKYVKKTTGIFVDGLRYNSFGLDSANYLAKFYDAVSLNNPGGGGQGEDGEEGDGGGSTSPLYSTHGRLLSSGVYGLEPVKPNRIQFSSMSIEQLYSKSLLDNEFMLIYYPYDLLGGSVSYYRNLSFKDGVESESTSSWQSSKFGHVIDNWWRSDSRVAIYGTVASDADYGNKYNIRSLLTSNFTQAVANRHPSPLGTVWRIVPEVRGPRRSMVIPVLTCKSKMKTSADSLVFETSQLFGMPKGTSFTPADVPEPTILNLGGQGLIWNVPLTPISGNTFPQWGDRSRTDTIDSMGTTALNVRVFEGWPIHQTLYFGHMFTPLHFNPSAPDVEKIIDYSAPNGLPVLKDRVDNSNPEEPKPIPGRSEVDFKIPTAYANENVGGFPLIDGTSIKPPTDTSPGNLAPYSLWKYNTIRRAKLLTNGGFVYIIRYVGIVTVEDAISLKTNGTGYDEGDTFVYPDGTTIEIKSIGEGGTIGNIEVTEGENGMTSVLANLQPQYLGSTGTGAIWNNVQFIVKEKYGYDPAPKEVVPTTRLTKPSNNGDELIEGNLSTTVSLNNDSGKSKEYDIFYFYHNDPTHYSMNRGLAFNGGWAQYAIVEVNPGA